MADLHHHHGETTSVVEERDGGPATALIALIIVLLVGFLIWLFAFSGIVFDNDGGGSTTQINEGPRIEQPVTGGDADSGTTDGGSTDGGDTGTTTGP